MITAQRACELAQKEMEGYTVNDCVDIGNEYVFSFIFNGELLPGTPLIRVRKKDGEISDFTIPPVENIDVLNQGKKIDFLGDKKLNIAAVKGK